MRPPRDVLASTLGPADQSRGIERKRAHREDRQSADDRGHFVVTAVEEIFRGPKDLRVVGAHSPQAQPEDRRVQSVDQRSDLLVGLLVRDTRTGLDIAFLEHVVKLGVLSPGLFE